VTDLKLIHAGVQYGSTSGGSDLYRRSLYYSDDVTPEHHHHQQQQQRQQRRVQFYDEETSDTRGSKRRQESPKADLSGTKYDLGLYQNLAAFWMA